LGLVPLGCVGMIFACILSALMIEHTTALVIALVIIGFFSGFYMVPLYTLLQHRAPKQSKGELIATSNFINVTGAIAASLLFFILVSLVQVAGITPVIPQRDELAVGELERIVKDEKHGRPERIDIREADGDLKVFRVIHKIPLQGDDVWGFIDEVRKQLLAGELPQAAEMIEFEENLFEVMGGGVQEKARVVVSSYTLGDVVRYRVRLEGQPLKTVYDYRGLPQFLFLGAALMTLGILILLVRKLPDFFVRTFFWLRSLGRFRLKAVNMHHLPTHGPVILATNCDRLEPGLQVVSVTDRSTLFVLWEKRAGREPARLLRALANRSSLAEMSKADHPAWLAAHERAKKALKHGDLLAITVDGHADDEVESLIKDLRTLAPAPIIPVYCGTLDGPEVAKPRVRVVFGEPAPDGATLDEVKQRIRALGEWIKQNDDQMVAAH